PRAELIEKQKIVKSLEVQLAAYPVTESQLAAVRRECDSLRQEIINVSGSGNDLQIFFSEYPQAFATLPAVSFLQWGEQVILNVNVNNGVMTVYCETHDLLRASMSLDFLRQHRLFSGAGTQNINTAATYGLTIELQRGTGVR
ncbi:MAG: hypothetical protein FWE82_10130, partial [Defluviitaleaceae bacterium]|nr:hypothetical protein [Defluviitaleaceae bacterium]